MKNSLETRLGLFFALVFVAAFVLFEMVGGGRFFGSGIPIKARFNTAGDLKAGDPVKLAGVDIGRVQSIRIADGKVEVGMTVEPAAGVRTDSKAAIKFTGMMGQNFVALDFGNAASPVVATGALLESREQPDLAAIMSKLESAAEGMQNMTKSFSGEEFSKLLGPMTDMIKDNQPRIASILGNIDSMTTGMKGGRHPGPSHEGRHAVRPHPSGRHQPHRLHRGLEGHPFHHPTNGVRHELGQRNHGPPHGG